MPDLDKIIADKLKLYETADDVFLGRIEKTQSAILKKVLGLLNQFDTKGGDLVNNETALQLIVSLDKEIGKILKGSTYEDKVSEYLKKFDKMQSLNEKLVTQANDIKLNKGNIRANLNTVKKQSIESITESLLTPFAKDKGVPQQIKQPIKDLVFKSVVTGVPIEEAKKNLNTLIGGTATKHGLLQRFVSQISRDALTQYDGLVNDVIRKEYDLNTYQYVGSLVEDSRCQCVRWVGLQFLPIVTLDTEISRAKDRRFGRGMNPETTVQNFAQFRGGFNCRHMAIPIRLSDEALAKATKRVQDKPWNLCKT